MRPTSSQLPQHQSVLYQETLEHLQPAAGGVYIDGTLGAGGHTRGLLEASAPDGRVVAFDQDVTAIALAKDNLGPLVTRLDIVHDNFAHMASALPALGIRQVDGVVLDLGLSSMQLDTPERGFSFRYDAPLDMRFNPDANIPTAAALCNTLSEADLANILWQYGEERQSRRLARAIVANRPIATTKQLANVIATAKRRKKSRTHPATQSFQALRIAVNGELDALETGVAAAIDLLKVGGRIAVISFHSLEDRFVKNRFRDLTRDCVCPPEQPICTCDQTPVLSLVTRRAIQPSPSELSVNPRSRSARLRVAEKV